MAVDKNGREILCGVYVNASLISTHQWVYGIVIGDHGDGTFRIKNPRSDDEVDVRHCTVVPDRNLFAGYAREACYMLRALHAGEPGWQQGDVL